MVRLCQANSDLFDLRQSGVLSRVKCRSREPQTIRLNSAVGYITPKDVLAGRQAEIHAERDRKLEEARKQRQIRRQQAA